MDPESLTITQIARAPTESAELVPEHSSSDRFKADHVDEYSESDSSATSRMVGRLSRSASASAITTLANAQSHLENGSDLSRMTAAESVAAVVAAAAAAASATGITPSSYSPSTEPTSAEVDIPVSLAPSEMCGPHISQPTMSEIDNTPLTDIHTEDPTTYQNGSSGVADNGYALNKTRSSSLEPTENDPQGTIVHTIDFGSAQHAEGSQEHQPIDNAEEQHATQLESDDESIRLSDRMHVQPSQQEMAERENHTAVSQQDDCSISPVSHSSEQEPTGSTHDMPPTATTCVQEDDTMQANGEHQYASTTNENEATEGNITADINEGPNNEHPIAGTHENLSVPDTEEVLPRAAENAIVVDDDEHHTVESDQTLYTPPARTQRVWEADRHASECRRCGRRFNFLVRRHHCRRCGLVVCDRCSSHRIRLPPEEIIQDPMVDPAHYPLIAMHPQRVCDACIRIPIKEVARGSGRRGGAANPMAMGHMKRSGSSQSLMTECPVCGRDLLGMRKEDQEKHLQACLNTGSPPVCPPRYIVYELSSGSPQIGYECPICFEEFEAGDRISRMVCLCSYHQHCLSDWLERGKGCPVHYDSTFST